MTEPREPESQSRAELRDPNNPPNSMLRKDTRRAALMSYLGPVVALFVVVGIALIYWANREPVPQDEAVIDGGIATTGSTEGGRDPAPAFDDANDELKYRGAGDEPSGVRDESSRDAIASVRDAAAASPGRTVKLQNAEVDRVESDQIWIHDGNNRLAVTMPENASSMKAGARVDVDGVTESDPSGSIRIRASRIHTR